MMAGRTAASDKSTKSGTSRLFLFHGPNTGLVQERAAQRLALSGIDHTDPFRFIRLTGDDLANDPMRLVDEANTISLFGDERVIAVEGEGRNIGEAVERLAAAPRPDALIVIECGALTADSIALKAVKACEWASAISCPEDSAESLEELAIELFDHEGVAIDADALGLLVARIDNDRVLLRNELTKLVLLTGASHPVTLELVQNSVAEAGHAFADVLVAEAFLGNKVAYAHALEQAEAAGTSAETMIGTALRFALLLYRSVLRRSGAFGPINAAHLRLWSPDRLRLAARELAEAAQRIRTNRNGENAVAQRALLRVMTMAASFQRT